MLLDRYLPEFDFNEVHSIEVGASQSRTYDALMTADLGRPLIVRLLTTLRSLPDSLAGREKGRGPITLRNLPDSFAVLVDDAPREIVLGIQGRFWQLSPDVCAAPAEDFESPIPVGTARSAWNFAIDPVDEMRSRLTTETRIKCADDDTRRQFGLYWALIQPGSALIRRAILRQVAREARFIAR